MGFSLLETLVVLALLSTVLAIGWMNFRESLPKTRVDYSAAKITYELQRARSEAVAQNTSAVVDLSTATRELTFWIDTNRNGKRDADEVRSVKITEGNDMGLQSAWTQGKFNAIGQFAVGASARDLQSANIRLSPKGGGYEKTLYIHGSGSITSK